MSVMVSVCIITYNQAKYIRKMLDSVLNQITNFQFEVLISDDASTDGTAEILREYELIYPGIIRLNINHVNLGATANSLVNYEKSSGKYIASIEGDDYWVSNDKLQRQVDFLENNLQYIAIQDRSLVVNEAGEAVDVGFIEKSKRFWEFESTEYTIHDFEKWKMPGQNSALVYRNFFLNKNLDYSVISRIHRNVGDRTIVLILVSDSSIFCSRNVSSAYRYITNSPGSNYVSSQNKGNFRYEEYKMMNDLENYSKVCLGKDISLNTPKKNTFVGAVCTYYVNKSLENRRVIDEIVKESHRSIYMKWLMVQVIIWRIFNRLIGTPNRRFPI